MGNRTALSALQDDFHEAVAKPFGLLRGEKRTKTPSMCPCRRCTRP